MSTQQKRNKRRNQYQGLSLFSRVAGFRLQVTRYSPAKILLKQKLGGQALQADSLSARRVIEKYQGLSLSARSVLGIFSLLLVSLLPSVAFAASFKEVVGRIIGVFNTIIPAVISIGVFLIIFGIFRYINAGDDPKKLAEGGKLVLLGVIWVFILFSIWGFVALILNTVFMSEDRASFRLSGQLWNVPN